MTGIKRNDIVEFFYETGECGFGLVIKVHDTETIGFATVAVLDALGKYIQIPFHRVKDTWRNLKGYVTRCDELTAEVKRLTAEVERLKAIGEESTKPRTNGIKAAVQTARKEVFFGKDINALTNAPGINDGRKGGE